MPSNNTNRPYLGFAIPTFNRCKLLDNLIGQITRSFEELSETRFEVCICDNGSSDATEEIVRKWQRHYPQIKYKNNGSNLGPQQNITNSFSLTSSEYVWILSDDDEIWDHSIPTLIHELESNPTSDLFLLNRSLCTVDMEFNKNDAYIENNQSISVLLKESEELSNYLNKCLNINGLGCYISSWVVKRSIGEKILLEDDEFSRENLFPHVYLLWNYTLNKNPIRLHYLNQPLVKWRAGNSLAARGLLGRAMHLHQLFRKIAPSKELFCQFEKMITQQYERQFTKDMMIRKGPPLDELIYAQEHFNGESKEQARISALEIQATALARAEMLRKQREEKEAADS